MAGNCTRSLIGEEYLSPHDSAERIFLDQTGEFAYQIPRGWFLHDLPTRDRSVRSGLTFTLPFGTGVASCPTRRKRTPQEVLLWTTR